MSKQARPRIGCYCRVSTAAKRRSQDKSKDRQEQYRQTFKSQKHAIETWATTNHIPTSELTWYSDRMSGKTMRRTALQRLLKDVQDGKIDTVVVYKLDRFARNLIEGIKTLADLAQRVRVVSVSENIDFSNSTGMLIASILLSVAQWQRETIVERIKDGLAARKAEGHRLGRPRDDERLAAVLKMHESGVGGKEIARQLGCSRANVYALLSRAKESAA